MKQEDRYWKLYSHALDILDGRANGHALPIIRKLAARQFSPAITILSDFVPEAQAIQILRKAARSGDATSAYNLAITHRNRGDMLGYRNALSRAAILDREAVDELNAFRTRFPEQIMRKFNRLAPDRAR